MIQPVKPIDNSPSPSAAMEVALRRPLAERLDHERYAATRFQRILQAEQLALTNRLARFGSLPDFHLLALQQWTSYITPEFQPYSAHPAFFDEIKRWWPSDNFPPDTDEIVIEDRQPDRVPDVVLLPARGGLLDVWV